MVGARGDQGDATTVLGVIDYQEPALQARVKSLPSDDVHGDLPLAWSWQQTILGWDVAAMSSASEQETRDALAELRAAITQGLNFAVTVTVGDADPETWTCQPGALSPTAGRTSSNLRRFNDPWSVTLPCYPVRA